MEASTQLLRPHRAAGFTLIELMVVVLIGAILVGIAVPSYTSHIRKSRRTDARTALLDLASREERYFSLNNAYTDKENLLGYSSNNVALSTTVGNGYYTISVDQVAAATVAAPATFRAKAAPAGTQVKDTQCAFFSVDQSGKQTATDSGGTDSTDACWN
jgi:type IV pilus assembly protein PilE